MAHRRASTEKLKSSVPGAPGPWSVPARGGAHPCVRGELQRPAWSVVHVVETRSEYRHPKPCARMCAWYLVAKRDLC